jgi:hypothetical protein
MQARYLDVLEREANLKFCPFLGHRIDREEPTMFLYNNLMGDRHA